MKKSRNIISKLPALVTLVILVAVWWAATAGNLVPDFMLPSPASVVRALVSDRGILMRNLAVTLQESAWGLLIGVAVAFVLSTVMHRVHVLYQALYPLLVVTQTVPTVAIAPLLVLWMGFDMAPKITLVALTTFFPVAVNLLEGYASTDRAAEELLRSMGAKRFQVFWHLELPSAMSHFFSGLKVSASYAVVGAVISEWLGGSLGLGVYMTRVRKAYAYDKMFAVILVIVALSLLLILAVTALRRVAMPWERYEKVKGEEER